MLGDGGAEFLILWSIPVFMFTVRCQSFDENAEVDMQYASASLHSTPRNCALNELFCIAPTSRIIKISVASEI